MIDCSDLAYTETPNRDASNPGKVRNPVALQRFLISSLSITKVVRQQTTFRWPEPPLRQDKMAVEDDHGSVSYRPVQIASASTERHRWETSGRKRQLERNWTMDR